jgi:hypothetical protein
MIFTATASAVIPPNLIPQLPAASTQTQERQLTPGVIYVYNMHEDRNFRIGVENPDTQFHKDFLLANDTAQALPMGRTNNPHAFTRLQGDTMSQTTQNFATYHSALHSHGWQWLSDSRHLVGIIDGKIAIMEYDGTNVTFVYSGPFFDNFVFPWADGSRIMILNSFIPDHPPNIYSISLTR